MEEKKYNMVRMEYTPLKQNQFERAFAYEFEYDPNDGIEELINGFRVFLRALTYSETTINQYIPDPDEVPVGYRVEIANEEVFDELIEKEKISNDRWDG